MKSSVFIDTGYILGLVNTQDQYHLPEETFLVFLGKLIYQESQIRLNHKEDKLNG
jgi:predicted nucleic acid-binding protein